MSTLIRVRPFTRHPGKEALELYGDEVGTPAYYQITDTLRKHLGDDLKMYWDINNDWGFVIENNDEGCDNTNDYVQTIESIDELITFYTYEGEVSCHLVFEILPH